MNGNLTSTIDANEIQTVNTYDPHNRLKTSTDGEQQVTTFEYDQRDNRTLVVDGKGNATRFHYDLLNRLTREVPVSAVDHMTEIAPATVYGYDAMNKDKRIDGKGAETHYAYDARHRLKEVRYNSIESDPVLIYSYDDVGNLLAITDTRSDGADVTRQYDAMNRLVSETSNAMTHSYDYNLAGLLIKFTNGASSRPLLYYYDDLNRQVGLRDAWRNTIVDYDLAGRQIGRTLPNGYRIAQQWDAQGRLRSARGTPTSQPEAVADFEFAWRYDAAGNVLRKDENWSARTGHLFGNRSVVTAYDDAYRLVTEAEFRNGLLARTTGYTYDPAGNRLTKTFVNDGPGDPSHVLNYSYNALNQLTGAVKAAVGASPVTLSYEYDANGNRESEAKQASNLPSETTLYGWDEENRLIEVEKAGATHRYGYDYRSRRIWREEPIQGETTQQSVAVFAGGLNVAELKRQPDGSNALAVEYVRNDGMGGGVGG